MSLPFSVRRHRPTYLCCTQTQTATSPDGQRSTSRHTHHHPEEGPERHDHRGSETPRYPRGGDRYGRGAGVEINHVFCDEEGREEDRGLEQCANHCGREGGGDWARHEERGRDEQSSASSGRYGRCLDGPSYNNSEPAHLLQRSPRTEHQARVPLDSSSGASSDRRSTGSDETIHTGGRRENICGEAGCGRWKREELSSGRERRQTTQKVRPAQ